MIKFFRKIRQRLLAQNKFSKYLMYALGEILLVMIGVLLAFQANKWKEDKAKYVLETKLISEIQTGLKNDLIDVNINYEWQKKILENQYKVIEWLQSDLEPHDSLTYQFSMATKLSNFSVSTAPFETLKEFGLNRISNDSLKHKIIRLYDVLYPNYRRGLSIYHSCADRLFDAGINHFDEWNLLPGVYTTKPKNIPQLKADHILLLRFKHSVNYTIYLVYLNSSMKTLLTETIDLIDVELKSREY